ncbi:MAG: SUF system NifU family Fe-S cluster assembly protein [Actinobacteria bacterium]|jgi:nitrogen fixation NifU-like protein|nr:SUF system NifU family Fe-S cluster assembly protein [Actinomycetota bacterium]MCZ6737793.1 SUF system NifU family Fe-S cluster assembly protein [Actinomycetota bacterium]
MALEELYREVILDHYRNPRNKGHLEHPQASAQGVNPLCGDEITIEVSFDGDRVSEVAVDSQGCSISQSSASMMTEAIKGKSREEINELVGRFRQMMSLDAGDDPGLDPERPGAVLGDIEALQGVRQYPVRIKCASLGWNTLLEALDAREPAGS